MAGALFENDIAAAIGRRTFAPPAARLSIAR